MCSFFICKICLAKQEHTEQVKIENTELKLRVNELDNNYHDLQLQFDEMKASERAKARDDLEKLKKEKNLELELANQTISVKKSVFSTSQPKILATKRRNKQDNKRKRQVSPQSWKIQETTWIAPRQARCSAREGWRSNGKVPEAQWVDFQREGKIHEAIIFSYNWEASISGKFSINNLFKILKTFCKKIPKDAHRTTWSRK